MDINNKKELLENTISNLNIINKPPPSFDDTIIKYKNKDIEIEVGISSARYVYYKITSSILVKLFWLLNTIFSHPATIIVAIILLTIFKQWLIIVYYFIGLIVLVQIENQIQSYVVVKAITKDKDIFEDLYLKGVFRIKEMNKK